MLTERNLWYYLSEHTYWEARVLENLDFLSRQLSTQLKHFLVTIFRHSATTSYDAISLLPDHRLH